MMKLASKESYPTNICRKVFGYVEHFDEVMSQVGYAELVTEKMHMLMSNIKKHGDKNIEKHWRWTLAYYRDGEDFKDIAFRYNLSVQSIRSGIESFLTLLIKYWDMNPSIPLEIRHFNAAVLWFTGNPGLIDILRSFGINTREDLVARCKVDCGLEGIPGIKMSDRLGLIKWLADTSTSKDGINLKKRTAVPVHNEPRRV